MRNAGRRIAGAICAMMLAVPAAAQSEAPPGAAIEGVAAIVDRLGALRRLDRAGVEGLVGRSLSESGGNAYFAIWSAGGFSSGAARVASVELREPKAGAGATAGPILVLRFDRPSASRGEVERRFGPLAVSSVPRGGSLDDTTALTRREALGTLSFSFTERHPDSLSSLSLAVPSP